MKRKLTASLAFFLLLAFSGTVWSANDKALFWKLETKRATVYLFGSIHLADKSFYPLRPEVEKAFASADALAVEADILNIDAVQEQRLLFQYGMYPAGERLTDHISQATLQSLESALVKHGVPLPETMYTRMRPGTLMVTLGYLMAAQSGLDASYGLDLHFLRQATENNKQILELEGSEQLMQLMASLGPADFLIQETIGQLDEASEMMAPMVEAWKQGDEKTLEKIAVDSMDSGSKESKALVDAFLYDRNHGMVEKIEGYIAKGGTYFVVAGSAHFVGDEGVPELLKKAGYSVERR
ncbi:TraB/GumN family protein [Porticoccus sp. W117]|uniref:TraB/GumN family protein n=1 Tax=Porticoccus sp. W117 TaxID=3054777 RepID=UPI002596F030|nr:TraB/GumN family protein [Porticoccus sp. W117]MDM3869971.1 TraB/GumN family protein [Porticoccus sp. W117]